MNPAHEAFQAVYLAHFNFVWGALRRLGVREQDALDMTQKVFLVVYRKLPEFESRSVIKTWLYRICLHTASDYRRSAAIRREVTTDHTELNTLAGSREVVSEEADARQRAATAEAILAKLPEAQREAFVLFEIEGMSGQEIAALLEVPLGTVRSRLRLARDAFTAEVERLSAADPERRKEAV